MVRREREDGRERRVWMRWEIRRGGVRQGMTRPGYLSVIMVRQRGVR